MRRLRSLLAKVLDLDELVAAHAALPSRGLVSRRLGDLLRDCKTSVGEPEFLLLDADVAVPLERAVQGLVQVG